MTRGLVDAILVAIRDASVAEIGHSSGAARARPGPSAGARSRADVATPAPRPAKQAVQAGRDRRKSAEAKPQAVGPVRAAIARRQARASASGRPDARAWDDGPDVGGGTAITDPESVLAAFGGEKASPVDAHAGAAASTTATTAASPGAASPEAPAGGQARPSLPALRENETALRTAGGGTVIRRKRSPVRAA